MSIWKLSKVLGGLAACYAILSGVAALYATSSYKPSLTSDASSIGFVSEEVEYQAEDGIKLRAWYGTSQGHSPVVVIFHSYRATRSQGLAIARSLASGGYEVLMPDFRGCGKSDGNCQTFGVQEAKDVAAAIRYLKEVRRFSPARIGVLGIGTGASAIILAHPSVSACGAAALVAPYSSLSDAMDKRLRSRIGVGMKPMGAVFGALIERRIGSSLESVRPDENISKLSPCPVLLVGAARDSKSPPSEIEGLFERITGPKDLYIVPEAQRDRLTDLSESLLRPKLLQFFDSNLR